MNTSPATAIDASPAAPQEIAADWLVVGVWDGELPSGAVDAVDGATGGLLARLRAAGDLTGKPLELLPIYAPPGMAAKRLLLVGLGRREGATRLGHYQAGAAAARAATAKRIGRLAAVVPDIGDGPGATLDAARGFGVGLAQGCYGAGTRKAEPGRHPPECLLLAAGDERGRAALVEALPFVRAEARGMWLARELVDAPPSELYPETFADRAVKVGGAAGIAVQVWDEERIAAERMGALLAVARGSVRPPRLVVLRYEGDYGGPKLGLVGKGVTFDSGGLSLKTGEQMADMKCDMAGAAAVLGGIQAIAEMRLPVNVLGVLPLVENMPGGRAMKLGDVLTARNGKTIEVLNTDAEGRLILADALAFAAEQNVAHLVDFATLTGACMVALGPDVAGLMTNDDAWGERVLDAVGRAGERAWKLPMHAHYDESIRSKVADMRNTGGSRYGGAIAAAKLLQQFVRDVPWAHLDIAGPAWADGEAPYRDAGGTGCMVRAIVELAARYSGG